MYRKFAFLRAPTIPFNQAIDRIDVYPSIFEEALYLSSPDLYDVIVKGDELDVKGKQKLDWTLLKYWRRACTRSTPYATFAGYSLLDITKEDTNIIISNDQGSHVRKVRLDMNYLSLLVNKLLEIPEIKKSIKYFPNNTIYLIANKYRYVEYRITNNIRYYSITEIDKTEYLDDILDMATDGCSWGDMVKYLTENCDVSSDQAKEYLEELCKSQILISELEPAVTGEEPLAKLLSTLEEVSDIEPLRNSLLQIHNLMRKRGAGVSYYRDIELKLMNLKLSEETPKNILQVDLALNMKTSIIDGDLIDEIVKQAEDLKFLGRKSRNLQLERFKKRFLERYEDIAVPLAVVLDIDVGIGYGNDSGSEISEDHIIGNLYIKEHPKPSSIEPDHISNYVLQKYTKYCRSSDNEIEIHFSELQQFLSQKSQLDFPISQTLFGRLMKYNGVLNANNFRFDITGFGGPSACNLFARFAQEDRELTSFTQDLLRKEENFDNSAIYVEVVHLPQARAGNILLRPHLRKYELPYVGVSGLDKNFQITIDDILVQIINGEIILKSRRLKKRIIPRLTTAHNFSVKSLPVYKFLCDLQAQGYAYPNIWDWGLLESVPYLPRVIYKNLIVRKARWNLSEKDFIDIPTNDSEYMRYFSIFRSSKNMPEKVVFKERDNELLLDLTDKRSLEMLLLIIKKHKFIVLEEFLFTDDNCIVRDENNNPYTSEVVIPVLNVSQNKLLNFPMDCFEELHIQKKFPPFSEWMYFKVYCGITSGDKILSTRIFDFITSGMKKKLFEKFFFVRYHDDFPHIRVRFYNSDVSKQKVLFEMFSKSLNQEVDSGKIGKISLDTYNRELTRYGNELIVVAEDIFCTDSLAVLRFLSESSGDIMDRIFYAVKSVDTYLDNFRFSIEEKRDFARTMYSKFYKEFGSDPRLKAQLNEKFRKYQNSLLSLIKYDSPAQIFPGSMLSILSKRSVDIINMQEKFFPFHNHSRRQLLLNVLLPSYMHMSINRLFAFNQRKYEMVIYSFLERVYMSHIATMQYVKIKE
ncbi:MAG TPA: lantibiotic dehydratase [Luteibaculaceae bacterium]|nr:lantibiotic dehydratase [Luteibaculaceae bacterium]